MILAAPAAAQQWKFTPLIEDGAAVKVTSVVVINYTEQPAAPSDFDLKHDGMS